jgi:hypothetical protein
MFAVRSCLWPRARGCARCAVRARAVRSCLCGCARCVVLGGPCVRVCVMSILAAWDEDTAETWLKGVSVIGSREMCCPAKVVEVLLQSFKDAGGQHIISMVEPAVVTAVTARKAVGGNPGGSSPFPPCHTGTSTQARPQIGAPTYTHSTSIIMLIAVCNRDPLMFCQTRVQNKNTTILHTVSLCCFSLPSAPATRRSPTP